MAYTLFDDHINYIYSVVNVVLSHQSQIKSGYMLKQNHPMSKLSYYTRHSLYGAALWMAGDLMSQYYEKSENKKLNSEFSKEWDTRRLTVMTGYGLGAGSLYYFWYQQLDKLAPYVLGRFKLVNTPLKLSATKLGIDLISFDPFFISLFFFSTSMLTGSTFDSFFNHYKAYFLPTYAVEALVWYFIFI